ncbi:MAG: nitroreductase family protein [Actinomycetota bacterium]|nr:nitroreductase family protein [Actinomycetota bacterium]MDD5665869.1 nitroreductase family protein [Actinomycetota bacterium]
MAMKIFSERRSIRRYGDRPVEDEKLEAVLEAARQAPSWANMQCWTYVVIKDSAVKEAVAETLKGNPGQKAILAAPVLIVACADPEKSGTVNGQPYYMLDVGISMQQLMLEAWNQGLGTCWIGWIKEDEIRSILGVPENIRVVALTPLGYPAVLPESPGRKPMQEIVHREKWG